MSMRIAVIVFCLFSVMLHAQYSQQRYPVIPKPQTLLALADNFAFSKAVTIVTEDKSTRRECEFFRTQVQLLYNINLKYGKVAGFEPCIWISLDSFDLPPEGYEMFITKEGINLYGSRAGIFYGLQTILQLIQADPKTGALFIPSCSIIDYPRFSWRGMHLDVARHFFPKENVKDYLGWMAMYKLNTFHWHLTDDQGWRIEIKSQPKLTTIGAWRNKTLIGHYSEEPDRYDNLRHGGFYTQQEVKEIVRYADSLHITVVPEIEMPGHACAMIASYPYLGNTNEPCEVQPTWGVFTQVLSPRDSTFAFLENVLTEVTSLFPGQYIHIGGDECPKEEWQESAYCQQLIQKNTLKDEHGLQSWFVQRIVNFLATKNKKAIGWDEILEGGLADGAAVMSWRGEDGGIAAAKAKHNVVMTPGAYCYFDHYQSQNTGEPLAIGGFLPVEKVYSYDPVPASLNAEEKKFIMGVQANVWTEYISTFSQVQYMVFPRMAALAEVAWTRTDIKDFNGFVPRVTQHMQLYDKMKVNYSRAMFEIKSRYEPDPAGNGILLHLSSLTPTGVIRYTRGGVELSQYDRIYTGPIRISGDETIFAAVFNGHERLSPYYGQSFTGNLAFGKSVTLRKTPSPSYNNGGAMTLTDGITGRTPWTGAEWLGWWGDTLDAVIDLGVSDTIHQVNVIMLRDSGSWIYSTENVQLQVSDDGKTFKPLIYEEIFRPLDQNRMQAEIYTTVQTRYIRIRATGKGTIPEGSPGAGYPAWLFVSEIQVK